MKILLVTEKYNPDETQRDGGARLVKTLKQGLGNKLSIMQFNGNTQTLSDSWNFKYPIDLENRFERRIANAGFIAEQISTIANQFTHIIFVHVSMQFGYLTQDNIETWTFPMFLTPSYEASGEVVPYQYTEMEKLALSSTKNILTPSYFEKKQLLDYYSISENKIHVIPRGVGTNLLKPITRTLDTQDRYIFCNIGSIKPQKNTLELIDLFSKLQNKYPNSILRIIGPIQDKQYYSQVTDKIKTLSLSQHIELTNYISPDKLSNILVDCHIHISTSNCETFGRSIFETLASGIPNVARLKNNAAYDFLQNLPYIKFTTDNNEALQAIDEILLDFPQLSSMACEIGNLYDDKTLRKLLVAKIYKNDTLIISDYDGTLFHKTNPDRTLSYIKKFKQFSPRIICSARSTEDLLVEIKLYNLEVDWIISYSGAVITDGKANILYINPLSGQEIEKITDIASKYEKIMVDNQVIQICTTSNIDNNINGFNIEEYQGKYFIANWKSSKLRAIHKLLDHINWPGDIMTLGDGKYDLEYLRYFDGYLVRNEGKIDCLKQINEVQNAEFIL